MYGRVAAYQDTYVPYVDFRIPGHVEDDLGGAVLIGLDVIHWVVGINEARFPEVA